MISPKAVIVMKRLLFLLLIPALALAGFTDSAAAGDCLEKTWKGTIGTIPVFMEFESIAEDDSLAGRYYYHTSLTDLILVKDDKKPGGWKELDPKGKLSGYLRLTCTEDTLTGSWSSSDGSKTLPVKAVLEPADYSKHRMGALKITGKRASIGGFSYETFKAQGCDFVRGVRLTGGSPAVAEINHALMAGFTEKLAEGIDCVAIGRMKGREDAYTYECAMEVLAWNKAFVVIGEKLSYYCGGKHPNLQSSSTVYNLQTSKPETISQWFIEKYREAIPKDSALGKIIIATAEIDSEECLEGIELYTETAWPTPAGMVFRPSADYSQSACIADVAVPYKKLMPYLSVQGKTNIRAFQGR